MLEGKTHTEILMEAAKYSPTGFRSKKRGQEVPKMDFSERINIVINSEDSDQIWGPLSIEKEKPM